MKYITIILLVLFNTDQKGKDLFISKNVTINLFSSALIEDIKASTSTGISVYNATTGELDFSATVSSFKFDKAFMQQHFNSDYMESDKYPRAIFKGKIQEHVDISKDGTYIINVAGDLTVHGITKARTIQGSMILKNGVITMTSKFIVKCADHHIDIPQILFYHIAENIDVNISATYSPYINNPSK
jgi:hypothetical protein